MSVQNSHKIISEIDFKPRLLRSNKISKYDILERPESLSPLNTFME